MPIVIKVSLFALYAKKNRAISMDWINCMTCGQLIRESSGITGSNGTQ